MQINLLHHHNHGLSRGGHNGVFHTSEIASPQLDAALQGPNADKLTSCSVPGLQVLTSKILARQPDLDQVFPNLEALDQALCDQIPQAFDRTTADVSPPSKLLVYTDGSKVWNVARAEEVAAWAFVVVATWENGDERIVGFQAAAVQCETNHDAWAGASVPDSYQAEVEAIIRALLWLCQEPLVQGGVPGCIVADSTSALFAADGTFNVFHPTLRMFVRPLHKFLTQITEVELRWQKSHVGNLYNELADHVAKHYARADVPHYLASPISQTDIPVLAWLWMTTPNDDPRFPICADDQILFPIPTPMKGLDCQAHPEQHGAQPSKLTLQIQLASHNVNSFKDSNEKDELSRSGRAIVLLAGKKPEDRFRANGQATNLLGMRQVPTKAMGELPSGFGRMCLLPLKLMQMARPRHCTFTMLAL